MPTIFFYGPELDKDKKRELIKAFTEKASELTGLDKSSFVVYLQETDADEVGVGGELLEDRLKKQYE
ncbi:MAG: 4-oxalocrotonate tautomerase [Clostridia bacterium 41_269]|nr:MAG: 4-oxalocrotonate tautomerase [Clostridia bacterium 41_269]